MGAPSMRHTSLALDIKSEVERQEVIKTRWDQSRISPDSGAAFA